MALVAGVRLKNPKLPGSMYLGRGGKMTFCLAEAERFIESRTELMTQKVKEVSAMDLPVFVKSV